MAFYIHGTLLIQAFPSLRYHFSMIWIIAAAIIAIYLWSSCLLFYREEPKRLESDESKCFDPMCRSISIDDGNEDAVLLIHGYPTTPAMYGYAAKRISEAGFDAYAPLIPTFGADWHDFQKTDFSSWYAWIEERYLELKGRYRNVFVIGTSMGGAMALKLAENHDPAAVAIIGAPVVYNSFFRDRIVTSWSSYPARIVGVFTPSIGAGIVTQKPDSNDGNEEWKGYKGLFPRQGASLVWNLRSIRRDLGKIASPLLSIHDRGDMTVPFANQGIIRREIEADAEFIETEMGPECHHTHHALLMYHSVQKELTDRIISFFRAHCM